MKEIREQFGVQDADLFEILDSSTAVAEAAQKIERARLGLAIVLDGEQYCGLLDAARLRHLLTENPSLLDGDIAGIGRLPNPALLENSSPLVVRRFLQEHEDLTVVPFTRRSGKLSRALTRPEALQSGLIENLVVVMAGGFGMRLRPITASIPKPLIPLVEGNGTLLDRILDHLLDCGFYRYRVAVHYLKDEIRGYLGDGVLRGVQVSYIDEETPLGTAGSLSYLAGQESAPIIVTNGDVITNQDFAEILRFHQDQGAMVTVVCKEDGVDISYGVVESNEAGELVAINEKPRLSYLINTGIYVIEPAVLNMVPRQKLFMTDLINTVRQQGGKISVFQTHEYWKDVGTIDCYAQVIKDIRSGVVRSFPPLREIPRSPWHNGSGEDGALIESVNGEMSSLISPKA